MARSLFFVLFTVKALEGSNHFHADGDAIIHRGGHENEIVGTPGGDDSHGTKSIPWEEKVEAEKDKEVSPQISVLQPILRFLQLLCENHNRDLQVSKWNSFQIFSF